MQYIHASYDCIIFGRSISGDRMMSHIFRVSRGWGGQK